MKKIICALVVGLALTVSMFSLEDGHCYITEENEPMWEEENIRFEYIIGLSIEQLMDLHPTYTYDEIYFIVQNVEG